MTDSGLVFYSLSVNEYGKMRVKYSLKISESMEFQVFVEDVCLNASKFEHIMEEETISTCSEVLNLLAFAKSSAEMGLDAEDIISHCCTLLESLLDLSLIHI